MDTVTIDRSDLLALMVATTGGGNDEFNAAWVRCWNALATTPAQAIALRDEISRLSNRTSRPLRKLDIALFADKIPTRALWVAMDADGKIFPFALPALLRNGYWLRQADDEFRYSDEIAYIDPASIDWRETLTPVNR